MAVQNEAGALDSITAADLILDAHKILGNKASGESLTASESDDGLEGLNSMLDLFSIERLMIFQIRQESFTWPTSTTSRTIGPSGDFDTYRPNRIEVGTFFRDSNTIDYPVDVVRERSTYDSITDKTVTSTYPEILFYDPSITIGTLYVYPVPNESMTLFINQWQPLQVFNNLTEALVLPPGYRTMIKYNLAEHLESIVGLPMSAKAQKIAANSKKVIKRNNNIPIYSATETFHALDKARKADIYAGK